VGLCPLNVQPGIDLDPHACHAGVLGEHDVCVDAVFEIGLVLELGGGFERFDALGGVF
jgi:hypothetical protein